jgi:hypothetical protein
VFPEAFNPGTSPAYLSSQFFSQCYLLCAGRWGLGGGAPPLPLTCTTPLGAPRHQQVRTLSQATASPLAPEAAYKVRHTFVFSLRSYPSGTRPRMSLWEHAVSRWV